MYCYYMYGIALMEGGEKGDGGLRWESMPVPGHKKKEKKIE